MKNFPLIRGKLHNRDSASTEKPLVFWDLFLKNQFLRFYNYDAIHSSKKRMKIMKGIKSLSILLYQSSKFFFQNMLKAILAFSSYITLYSPER